MKRATVGFTLIELLAVVVLMALLAALAVPAFVSVAQGQGMKRAVRTTSDFLELARSEAMAKSTWVWVGLADTTQDNVERRAEVTLSSMMSKDGSTNTSDLNLTPVAKPARISDVKILPGLTPWAGDAIVAKGSIFHFSATVAGKARTFTSTVVAFSPQGEALLNSAMISPWMEIGLQEVRSATPVTNKTASIRVSGISGQVIVEY